MLISQIVAMASNRVIGYKGEIPWKIPGEQKMFKDITMGHAMIMGRKTYESIGRALPGRTSIVITRQSDYMARGCIVVPDLKSARPMKMRLLSSVGIKFFRRRCHLPIEFI